MCKHREPYHHQSGDWWWQRWERSASWQIRPHFRLYKKTLTADGLCPPFPPFFTTETQLLDFQLIPSAGCGGTNQRALLATVLGGLGCETKVTAVKVFWLESLLVREGSTSFCPILPCFPWLLFNPGSFHSPNRSNLLPKTFVLLWVLSPSFCIQQDVLPICGLLSLCCSLPRDFCHSAVSQNPPHTP